MSRIVPRSLLAALLVALAWTLWTTLAVSGEAATAIPAPVVDAPAQQSAATETAVLVGGCSVCQCHTEATAGLPRVK